MASWLLMKEVTMTKLTLLADNIITKGGHCAEESHCYTEMEISTEDECPNIGASTSWTASCYKEAKLKSYAVRQQQSGQGKCTLQKKTEMRFVF